MPLTCDSSQVILDMKKANRMNIFESLTIPDVTQLESKVAAMKDVHQSVQEELRSVREQLSTTEFERETERINKEEVEITLANVQKELEATNKSLAEQSNDPKIQELTR